MPRPHTTMRQIRNVLRLRFAEKLSVRDTAASLAMARSTVADHLHRARVAGLSWTLPEEMDDDELERRLFPTSRSRRRVTDSSPSRQVYVPIKVEARCSISEAASILGISRSTAWKLNASGEFPVRVLNLGSRKKVLVSDLLEYLQTGVPYQKPDPQAFAIWIQNHKFPWDR